MTLSVSNDTVVCRGEALSLSAIATGGEGGFVYSWSSIPAFGENQYVAPSNSFSYPVQVTDICGETLTQTVEVEVQYIYSDFYTSYLSDTRIEFIATPEPPCPNCAYDWDFGDGASSEEISPTHEYDGLGDYYAQLTITNPLGCRDSAYTLVEGPVMVYIPMHLRPTTTASMTDSKWSSPMWCISRLTSSTSGAKRFSTARIQTRFGWAMSREESIMLPMACTTIACVGRGHGLTRRSFQAPLS